MSETTPKTETSAAASTAPAASKTTTAKSKAAPKRKPAAKRKTAAKRKPAATSAAKRTTASSTKSAPKRKPAASRRPAAAASTRENLIEGAASTELSELVFKRVTETIESGKTARAAFQIVATELKLTPANTQQRYYRLKRSLDGTTKTTARRAGRTASQVRSSASGRVREVRRDVRNVPAPADVLQLVRGIASTALADNKQIESALERGKRLETIARDVTSTGADIGKTAALRVVRTVPVLQPLEKLLK